jgi:N-acyl homoserine lactone hydrolase
MNAPASITVTPVFVADLHVEGERMPIYVHVIDHPDARVLVDTGMTELHPAMAGMDPRLRPLSEPDFDLAGIDIVVNTHRARWSCYRESASCRHPGTRTGTR